MLQLILTKVPWGGIAQGVGSVAIFEEIMTTIGLMEDSGSTGEVTLALSTATANEHAEC